MEVRSELLSKAEKGLKVKVVLSVKNGETDTRGVLLSRGFSEPYVGSHRLIGRLVPGLPGILECTSPNTHAYTHTYMHAVFLSSSFSDNHLSHPSHLHSVKIPPPLSSNLTFFSGADLGRPTLFPTARQKPALWSEPEPLCQFPLSYSLSLPRLPAFPTALLYWFTSPTTAVCLCFAPPAPWSLIFITLPSFPFSLLYSLALPLFSYFLSVPSYTTLGCRGENLRGRTHEKEKRNGRNGCGRGNRAFDFSLEAPPYFNIGFNRALMP